MSSLPREMRHKVEAFENNAGHRDMKRYHETAGHRAPQTPADAARPIHAGDQVLLPTGRTEHAEKEEWKDHVREMRHAQNKEANSSPGGKASAPVFHSSTIKQPANFMTK